VNTDSYKVGHLLAYLFVQIWFAGDLLLRENLAETDPLPQKLQFPIFAISASAVIPSEKSSINTNRKSTVSVPMSLIWTSYVALKSAKGWLKNAKCSKFEQ